MFTNQVGPGAPANADAFKPRGKKRGKVAGRGAKPLVPQIRSNGRPEPNALYGQASAKEASDTLDHKRGFGR